MSARPAKPLLSVRIITEPPAAAHEIRRRVGPRVDVSAAAQRLSELSTGAFAHGANVCQALPIKAGRGRGLSLTFNELRRTISRFR